MATLTEAWNAAQAALPPGWRLEGLRCTSTGLSPSQRGTNWIAEVCGPGDECIEAEHSDPQHALASLARRLTDIR